MEENQVSEGRSFAAGQFLFGQMDPDGLIDASEEGIEQALERDEIDRAEFWIGIREQARLFKIQEIPRAQRQAEAPFEILYVFLRDGGESKAFCFREQTVELMRDIAKRAGDNFSHVLVRQAYFEEIGALCLTEIPEGREANQS